MSATSTPTIRNTMSRGEVRALRAKLFKRQGGICYLCGAPMLITTSLKEQMRALATFDHLTPRALGGGHDPSNLKMAHRGCNELRDHSNIVGVPLVLR